MRLTSVLLTALLANSALAQDTAYVGSNYLVKVSIDTEELSNTPRYKVLLQTTNMSEEDLVNSIRSEAEQSLKLELISLSAIWERAESDSLRVKMLPENVNALQNCFPSNIKWLAISVVPTDKPVDDQAKKFKQLKAEPPFDVYLGMTYKEAVTVVRETETAGNEVLCRLVSVDGLLLVNPYATRQVNYDILNFEVEGGRIVNATLLPGPK